MKPQPGLMLVEYYAIDKDKPLEGIHLKAYDIWTASLLATFLIRLEELERKVRKLIALTYRL